MHLMISAYEEIFTNLTHKYDTTLLLIYKSSIKRTSNNNITATSIHVYNHDIRMTSVKAFVASGWT